jgi:L-2-hydroxyglutarate oxidase LhgO
MVAAGSRSMVAYATGHAVDVEVTGKVVVTSDDDDLPGLHRLAERAPADGMPARLVTATEARELQPYPVTAGCDDQTERLDDTTILCGTARADEPGTTDVWSLDIATPGAKRRVFIPGA